MSEINEKLRRPKPDHFHKPERFHDYSRFKAMMPEKPMKKEPKFIFKPLFQGEGATAKDGDLANGRALSIDAERRRRTRKGVKHNV